MKIELKTKNLKEIVKICETNGYDLKNCKIETEIWTDASKCEDFVKVFLKCKK